MAGPADDDQPGADDGAERSDATRGLARRLTGVVPVAAALLALAAVVLVVWPDARHAVGESFARQDEHYVELFFADEKTARTCPVDTDGAVVVRAALTSHLAGDQDLTWTIRLRPDGTAGTTPQAAQQATGTLATRPDRTTRFGAELAVPSGPYTVVVTLGSRAERLVLHC